MRTQNPLVLSDISTHPVWVSADDGMHNVAEHEMTPEAAIYSGQASRAVEEEATASVQRCEIAMSNTSADERYKAVHAFVNERYDQALEADVVGANFTAGRITSFGFLDRLYRNESSHYTKRLLEWGMMREVHGILEGDEFAVDRERSASDAVQTLDKEYDYQDFLDKDVPGVVYRLSESGEEVVDRIPEAASMLEFARQHRTDWPRLGDPGYYAPDPYLDQARLLPEKDRAGIPGDELELALETVAVFGVGFTDIDPVARSYLYHTGVNLTDEAWERLRARRINLTPRLKLICLA